MTVVNLPKPSSEWALFLDVDGTLIEIADTPTSVVVEARMVGHLRRLEQSLGGALALVSGRQIAELDRLFTPLRLPCAGIHGLERRRADGTLVRHGGEPKWLAGVRDRFREFAASHPGILVEEKGLSVGLHYRQVPRYGDDARALARVLVADLGSDLHVLDGKCVIEVKPADHEKGAAIDAFMSEPPFIGRHPVFLGDDVTDEDGFRVVNRLGGDSIRVGLPGPTIANARIESVIAVHAWLDQVALALDEEQ
jgi:trehalose 6-phosphate phosphatase